MDFLTSPYSIIILGLLIGVVMGATARRARFCTFGAIEDFILAGKTNRLKAWALAIAVAIICVQIMHSLGLARMDQAFYLDPLFGVVGAILGGLLFGLGMSMVGTCGYGIIIRVAGGDLKAICNFLVLGFTGYMTARGLLSIFRTKVIDRLEINLEPLEGQGIPHVLSWISGIDTHYLWLPVGSVIGGYLLIVCLRDASFRQSTRDVLAGLLIGLSVSGAFLATGFIGADPFNEIRVEAISYVLPLGETLIWLMTYTGATITFPVAVVIGTFLGAFMIAYLRRELCWESFEDLHEMRRHMLGATAMGVGGVTAHGCTIGQGISGVSTLAIAPFLTLVSIFIGATFGLHWLLTGSKKEALLLLIGRHEGG